MKRDPLFVQELREQVVVHLRQGARARHFVGVGYLAASFGMAALVAAFSSGSTLAWIVVAILGLLFVMIFLWMCSGSEEIAISRSKVTHARRGLGRLLSLRTYSSSADHVEFSEFQLRPDAMLGRAAVAPGRLQIVLSDGRSLRVARSLFYSTEQLRQVADVLESAIERVASPGRSGGLGGKPNAGYPPGV